MYSSSLLIYFVLFTCTYIYVSVYHISNHAKQFFLLHISQAGILCVSLPRPSSPVLYVLQGHQLRILGDEAGQSSPETVAGNGVLLEVHHVLQQDPQGLVEGLLGHKVPGRVGEHWVLVSAFPQGLLIPPLLLEGGHRAETLDLLEWEQVDELALG